MAKVKLFEGIIIPTGHPGKLTCGSSYRSVIRAGLRKKYGEENPQMKEWWHHKHTVARRKKAQFLWDKQNGQCIFCNHSTSFENREKGTGRHMATLDHILPQSLGGTDHLSNMVIACKGCNMARGSMDFFEFANLRWSTSDIVFRAALNSRKNKEKNLRRLQVKKAKIIEMTMLIGMLLYYRPEWLETVQAIQKEHRVKRLAGIARRTEKKRKFTQNLMAELKHSECLPESERSAADASPLAPAFLPSESHDPVEHGFQQSYPGGYSQPLSPEGRSAKWLSWRRIWDCIAYVPRWVLASVG